MTLIHAPQHDGLAMPEVGSWSADKYSVLHAYEKMFTSAMQGKWDTLVYVDLFAGAGWAQLRDTKEVVLASPLLAMELEHRFDGYILCEQKEAYIDALELRVERDYPGVQAHFVPGDCNSMTPRIVRQMDEIAGGGSQLAFCFVDPTKLSSLKFDTIAALADRLVDFVVLIPTEMDARRNRERYEKPGVTIVDQFVGDPNWREEWDKVKREGRSFVEFLVDAFGAQMRRLGYQYRGIGKTRSIKAIGHQALYRLAFFSRDKLGNKFWDEAVRYGPKQRRLPGV